MDLHHLIESGTSDPADPGQHRATSPHPRPDDRPRRRRRRRHAAGVIAAALAAALVTLGVARLLGISPVADRGAGLVSVTAVDVVVATIVTGLAAWGVQTLLVNRGRATWWPFVGSTLLAVSIVGPAYQADGASSATLVVLHVVVGAVLVAGFARSPRTSGRA